MSPRQAMSGSISLMELLYNANPALVRADMGDMDALKKDLQTNGMRFPVLAQPDYLIIDGGRRAVAARELGWDWVPTQLTRNWDEVCGRLAINNTQPDCKPMRWLETGDLITRILKPLYNPVRLTRERTQKSRSRFFEELQEPLQMNYTQIEHVVRIHGVVESARDQPELHNRMRELVTSYEPYGSDEPYGRIHSVHRMLLDLRNIWRKTGQLATPIMVPPSKASVTRPRTRLVTSVPETPVLAPAEQLQRITSITETLEALAREIASLGAINPLLPAEDIADISKRLWTPQHEITVLRTKVRNHVKEGQPDAS